MTISLPPEFLRRVWRAILRTENMRGDGVIVKYGADDSVVISMPPQAGGGRGSSNPIEEIGYPQYAGQFLGSPVANQRAWLAPFAIEVVE